MRFLVMLCCSLFFERLWVKYCVCFRIAAAETKINRIVPFFITRSKALYIVQCACHHVLCVHDNGDGKYYEYYIPLTRTCINTHPYAPKCAWAWAFEQTNRRQTFKLMLCSCTAPKCEMPWGGRFSPKQFGMKCIEWVKMTAVRDSRIIRE